MTDVVSITLLKVRRLESLVTLPKGSVVNCVIISRWTLVYVVVGGGEVVAFFALEGGRGQQVAVTNAKLGAIRAVGGGGRFLRWSMYSPMTLDSFLYWALKGPSSMVRLSTFA